MRASNSPYIPSIEQVAIARGDIVNHSKVAEMVSEANPYLLNLIIFNKKTHDELKIKALKKIADPDNQDFDLKTKKFLISKSIKESNFGNHLYHEAKYLLKKVKEDQYDLTAQIIKEHIQYVLDTQKALDDPDFKMITSDVDLLKNALRFQMKIGKGIISPALWNYVRMVKWAQYLEDDEAINRSLNNSLIEELEPIIALDEWERADEIFGDPKHLDTLIYSTFHKICLDLHNDTKEIMVAIEEANKIIDKFDELVKKLEEIILKSQKIKSESENRQREEIEKRIAFRKEREVLRNQKIGSSSLQYIGEGFDFEASINNRWP